MVGFIIWLVIIIWIVYAVSRKNQQTGSNGQRKPNAAPKPPVKAAGKNNSYDPWQGYNQSGNAMKQQATKDRLQKKYGRPSQGQGDILQRAKASVAEDFDRDQVNDSGTKISGTKTSSVQEARRRQQEMERRIAEKLAMAEAEQSDIMKQVEDLMVKGPDTAIAFERDFVSEGLELLSRIQS